MAQNGVEPMPASTGVPASQTLARAPRIAVIGLGSMGLGIAASLARAGHPVTGCDTDDRRIALFAAAGGKAVRTPAEAAAGADILVIVVVNAAQAEAVLFGEAGAADAMARHGLVICSVTMSPDAARQLAGDVEKRGLDFLDAPISGGAERAANGALTVLASGSAAAFTKARPVLADISAQVYELGDTPGIAAAFKMINQLLAGVHIAAACEAIAFAAKQSLDLDKVYEVICASAGQSWMFQNRVPHILKGDYEPKSAVGIFVKDLGILMDMARSERFPLPVGATALQMFLMASSAGMERDDDASVARVYERMTGIALPG